jgi:hypothetical protein
VADERAATEEDLAEWYADLELSDPLRDVPPKEEPDCYACCDSGCVECDWSIEGPRSPWWWSVVPPEVWPRVTEDEDGKPCLDGQPLFGVQADEMPF